MLRTTLLVLALLASATALRAADEIDPRIAPFFKPPAEMADDLTTYRSYLHFQDGSSVVTPDDWQKRRKILLNTWNEYLGEWPPLLEKPAVEVLEEEHRENFTQKHVNLEIAPGVKTTDAYVLIPDGKGPFPAVLVVYYDAKTGIGLGKEMRGFGYDLAKRGFVILSLGGPAKMAKPASNDTPLQPLSYMAYVAANCHTALSQLPQVDPQRIGVTGHSYGGKWAMFASCLYDKFACATWSDGGIVFDESRGNVNYWEPWYLGFEEGKKRERGIPSSTNPRTGPYKALIESRHDLHELHALMAPRPFLVSGGAEDHPQRWRALNHAITLNKLLGYENRVAMTNRKEHAPNSESNEQMYLFFEQFLQPAK